MTKCKTLSFEEKELRKQQRRQKRYNETHKIINGEDHKLCSKCNEWFPSTINYFYPNKSNGIDGLNPYCIECTKKKSVKWAKDNPERRSFLKSKYDKNSPHVQQMKRDWNIKNVQSGGFKRWQQENKEKLKEYYEQRLHKNHKISIIEWEDCKKYFNHRCAYCGLAIEDHWITIKGISQLGDFHKEHVHHDGMNDLSNCVPSCRICNSAKHNKEFLEWYNENNNIFSQVRLDKIIKWIEEDYKTYIKLDET